MAAFSITNTNILSHYQLQRRLPPLPLRLSSNLVKYHSTLQFPINHNKQVNCSNTSTAPMLTADAHDTASPSITSTSWAEFSEKVSGEWDGFGADFTAEGKPIELPESVVPAAYREWEVKVFDWQTQCPTLAAQSHNNCPSLTYKNIKLLPTVGCEADAATIYTIQDRNITAPHSCSAFAYLSSTGSYVAVWSDGHRINNSSSSSTATVELEHCLVDPNNRESRVRIIQVLNLDELILIGVKVFVEQWYGPFRNGDQLGGCAIRDSAFAATEPLKASQVSGVWEGLIAVANFHTCHNMIKQLGGECASKSIRDEDDQLILLPKQLWCSVKRAEDMGTCCEVGWLLDKGGAITSKCIISSAAQIKEITMASETAISV